MRMHLWPSQSSANIFHGIMADVFVLNRQQPCWGVKFKSLGNHANILFLFLLTERMIFHDSHIMWKPIIDNKTKDKLYKSIKHY